MRELELPSDAQAVIHKWQSAIEGEPQLTDLDLFNLSQDLLKARSRKWPTAVEVELNSTLGQIVLAYFPQDPKMPESLWIEIDEGKGPISYDIQRQNDSFRIFLLEGLGKGDPQLISLTEEKRIEIAKRLLQAHKLTPPKRRTVLV